MSRLSSILLLAAFGLQAVRALTVPGVSALNGGAITGCASKTQIALTFDDGPGNNTASVLALLSSNGVRASFFQIGENVNANPLYTKAIYDAGHMLGSHTYTHPDCTTLTSAQLSDELSKTDAAIKAATGATPVFFRYPYGNWSASTDEVVIGTFNKIPILWDVDTQDWDIYATNPAGIFGLFPAQVSQNTPTQGVINLQHSELYYPSVGAIQDIISWGKSNGFTFVSIPECIGYTGGWYVNQTTAPTFGTNATGALPTANATAINVSGDSNKKVVTSTAATKNASSAAVSGTSAGLMAVVAAVAANVVSALV